jgi:hypothetical protein
VAGAGAGRHSTAAWLGELRAPMNLATFSTKSMAGSYLVGCATRPRWSGGAFRRQLGRTQGQWSSGFGCFGFFYVAIVLYWCCNNIFVMLQLIVIVMPSFVVHVLIVVNMLHSRSRHVVSVLCECFKIRSKYFDVANINF